MGKCHSKLTRKSASDPSRVSRALNGTAGSADSSHINNPSPAPRTMRPARQTELRSKRSLAAAETDATIENPLLDVDSIHKKRPSTTEATAMTASKANQMQAAPFEETRVDKGEKSSVGSAAGKRNSLKRMDIGRGRATASTHVAHSSMNGTAKAGKRSIAATTSKLHNTLDTNPRWQEIFTAGKASIVDPADVTSIIDERLSAVIDLLSPTEITFVQRRVREVMRSIISSTPSNGGASAMGTMMGRLTGNGGIIGQHVGDDVKSRVLYQKENVLDENVIRKVFVGGDKILSDGFYHGVATALRRKYEGLRTNEDTQDVEESHHYLSSDEQRNSTSLVKVLSNSAISPTKNGTRHSRNFSGKLNHLTTIDPIGAAFILFLHLSETRWDHVAIIARLSAEKANLVLDVNHDQQTKQQVASKTNSDITEKTSTSRGRSIPSPSPLNPSDDDYGDELPPPPTLSSGISFRAICFVIAMALRGTREQRLSLLFYLLFPPKDLSEKLSICPAGGVPIQLLEVGFDSLLSFASLSHYFYHGGSLPGGISENEIKSDPISADHMVLDPKAVIDTLVILIHNESYSDQGILDAESPTRQSGSTGDVKYHKGNSRKSVSEYLCDVRNGTVPVFENECTKRERNDLVRKILKASDGVYLQDTTWTQDDFNTWALAALSDEALDAIMNTIFGSGILPSASMERHLVCTSWMDWQNRLGRTYFDDEDNGTSAISYVAKNIFNLFPTSKDGAAANNVGESKPVVTPVWGGLGGFDGRGGLGHGVMYCIDKRWWNQWQAYSGWQWFDSATELRSRIRPHDLSTEQLLDRKSNSVVGGTLGSYELMRQDVRKNVDYVIIPPGVWDVLYELYGGGPPIPRMVLPPSPRAPNTHNYDPNSVEVVQSANGGVDGPMSIPHSLDVVTHPWIIHCHTCDPQQPYRRGDAGPISIRLMATKDQELWRLLAEVVTRLPVNNLKARDATGQGHARLWRRVDPPNLQDNVYAAIQYGPWMLLCKNRHATIPVGDGTEVNDGDIRYFEKDWKAYADHVSVESAGLCDGAQIMLEFALIGKDGSFTWPREAAAKAGRLRRLADEDTSFRRMLRGLDERGNANKGLSPLVGKLVDAMDASGRWYQTEILSVDTSVEPARSEIRKSKGESSEDNDSASIGSCDLSRHVVGENKAVRVDFSEFGGHEEWIDVGSDRLAVAGRFTLDSSKNPDSIPANNVAGVSSISCGDANSRISNAVKKSDVATNNSISAELNNNGAICTYPGFGACGLTNLGNTCYANSALQCMSYMPLLRSYLLSGQYRISGDLNKDNPLGTGGKLLEEFADLLRTMWSGKYSSRAPTRFRLQLGRARSQYSAADQQDAQELLNDMLDTLHEDSNKVKKKPYVEALEDDWVKDATLPRVGIEAWRRFLRRNQSIITNTAMGQVLNRVTCPTCNHTSRNFDPFNMLSIPFPTISEVIFRCRVVRRGTSVNCPSTLALKLENEDEESSNISVSTEWTAQNLSPPSPRLIIEEYIIPMSRLADIGDLKFRLQNLSGIASTRFKLCKAEEIVVNSNLALDNPVRTYMKLSALPDKEGPCVQLVKQVSSDDLSTPSNAATLIVAFESTLNPRQLPRLNQSEGSDNSPEEGSVSDEDEDEERKARNTVKRISRQQRQLKEDLKWYGDERECKQYDFHPLPLAKAMSRSMWPKSAADFKLGLRVDAIDHRGHWFPGSVVEIIEGTDEGRSDDDDESSEASTEGTKKTQVRIHFDNFSSKWDETYFIDQFRSGHVRPLYSHANPKAKPTEFFVHHRHGARLQGGSSLFGQSFFVQCHIEWSTVRAGAQILAQASRFLQPPSFYLQEEVLLKKSARKDNSDDTWQQAFQQHTRLRSMAQSGLKESEFPSEKDFELYKATWETRGVISKIIDVLVEADRDYVSAALLNATTPTKEGDEKKSAEDDGEFNASAMSARLSKKLRALLPRLPFEIRICAADSPLGTHQGVSSDEGPFPFSLVRTIGNYMNARHAVVLHWRQRYRMTKVSKDYFSNKHPLFYVAPQVVAHKRSRALLNGGRMGNDAESVQTKGMKQFAHGSMQIAACLNEFCKEQHLPESDCWRCPKCKTVREGRQSMAIWKLPDLLTFHMKRFNCSARWREKITTKVNFPLTGLNMKEWVDMESPAIQGSDDSYVYDLIGVVNHYGGMTGGHYVATCKATACGAEGSEEVSHTFNGAGISIFDSEDEAVHSGGRKFGRNKDKDSATAQTRAALAASLAAANSAEPLWLQFDDDLVEPIPPKNVVSEMAYVLFYRRRRISPSNIAKFSTLD